MSDERTILTQGQVPKKPGKRRRGVVLIAVLIVVTLLALAAYQYGDLMLSEYRASETLHKNAQARRFADSGVHYAAALLSNPESLETLLAGNPWNNPQMFQHQEIKDDAGNVLGYFSIIAPADPVSGAATEIVYGVTDEGAKINLNAIMKLDSTGKRLKSMLILLPNMTDDIANSIVAWMGGSDGVKNGGASNDYYSSQTPPYRCKNGPIDSLDELLLVRGVTRDLLYGTDLNRNGSQDPTESTSITFSRGWSAYLTVHSREQNCSVDGKPYVYLNNPDLIGLVRDLSEHEISDEMINFIIMYRQYGPGSPDDPKLKHAKPSEYTINPLKQTKHEIGSIFDLAAEVVQIDVPDPSNPKKKVRTIFPSPLNDPAAAADEFAKLYAIATLKPDPELVARINVNTAPAEVLATLPGLTENDVQKIVFARQSVTAPNSIAWLLTDAQLNKGTIIQLEPYITTRTQVYRVQVVGYFPDKGPSSRVEAVIDTNAGRPRIVAWRDLTDLGKGWTNPNSSTTP